MQQQTIIIIIVAIIKDPTIGIVIIAHKGKPSSSEISISEFLHQKVEMRLINIYFLLLVSYNEMFYNHNDNHF